jgi:hypothetical protein
LNTQVNGQTPIIEGKDHHPQQLKELVNHLVDDRFRRNYECKNIESDYIPKRLGAMRWHCSESFLRKLKYQGKIKFYKFGTLAYVKISEVEALFEKGAAA